MKRASALAGAIILAGLMTGCGTSGGGEPKAGSVDQYCDALRDANEEWTAVSGDASDPKRLDSALQRISEVAAKAPDEVQPQWEILDGAITEVRTGLKEAGLTFEDIAKLSENSSALPKDVDRAKLMELGTTMQQMRSEEFSTAADEIRKHAKSECDLELGS